MNGISILVTTFGVVLAALLTIAGVVGTWAALRVGKNAQTLKNLQSESDSWKGQYEAQKAANDTQENEIRELRTENSNLRSEVAELRGRVTSLGDLVKAAIAELASPNSTQHKEVIEKLDVIASQLGGTRR